jgi:hypothetical protein
MPDDVFWFGFDCAHMGDRTPGYEAISPSLGREIGATYRTMPYVRAEVESLATQLKNMEGK